MVRSNFKWHGVDHSLDRINRALCYCRTDTARKICTWRKTQAALSMEGTWIYILWCPADNQVYIGQCGAKFGERDPFQRYQEHIRAARDFHLLKRNRRQRVPLYEWIQKHGFGSIQMTLLERVSHVNANARETYWMHRFGKTHLLNRQIPDLRQPRWEWLSRVKSFAGKRKQAAALPHNQTVEQAANHFVQTRHSVLTPAEKLQLVLDTRRVCDSQLASLVYQKAKEHIKRDTGTTLHRTICVRIPLMSPALKRAVTNHIQRVFLSHEKLPELYRHFLASSVNCVRASTPRFGDFCKSYRPQITTDRLVHDVLQAQHPNICNCQHMHAKFGLPLVHGHVFTRDFSWVSKLDPTLSPSLFHQNLKNPLLPSWRSVSRSLVLELNKALSTIHGLEKPHRMEVIAETMGLVDGEYRTMLRSTPSIHHVSEVKRSVGRLPQHWVLGMFDKGTTVLYAFCKYMFVPQLHKGFMQAGKRFTELSRCHSASHAAYEVCAYTVTAAKAFVNGRKFQPNPKYPVAEHLLQRGVERLKKAREPLSRLPPMTGLARSFWNAAICKAETKLHKYHKGYGQHADRSLTRGLLSRKGYYKRRDPRLAKANKAPQCSCLPYPDPLSYTGSSLPAPDATVSSGEQPPPPIFQLGYDMRKLIYQHLDVADVESLIRSHWTVMEWVYDILLIFTPVGPVRNEKYEKLLWYCNKVSSILQCNTAAAAIDCDEPDPVSTPITSSVPLLHPEVSGPKANPVLLMTIEAYCRERAPEQTRFKLCPAPNSQYLFKFKSHECDTPPVIKGREVVTNATHALKTLCSLMGRALTVFWKLSINFLMPREIIAMKDLLGCVRTWAQKIRDLPGDFQWLELDIKEMFPEIPRDDIVPALKHLHKKIKEKTQSSSMIYFYLSKDGCRQMDTTVSSPRATHWRFSFSDLVHFVSFDTNIPLATIREYFHNRSTGLR